MNRLLINMVGITCRSVLVRKLQGKAAMVEEWRLQTNPVQSYQLACSACGRSYDDDGYCLRCDEENEEAFLRTRYRLGRFLVNDEVSSRVWRGNVGIPRSTTASCTRACGHAGSWRNALVCRPALPTALTSLHGRASSLPIMSRYVALASQYIRYGSRPLATFR